MHAPAANPVPSDIFVRVLGQERLRYARQLNRYRCAGVTLFLVLELVVDPPWKRPANLWHVGFLVLYFGLSLSVLLAGKRSDRVARWSARVVPFVDMPMVFLIQFSDFGQTTNPRALADFTLGVFDCPCQPSRADPTHDHPPVRDGTASQHSLVLD